MNFLKYPENSLSGYTHTHTHTTPISNVFKSVFLEKSVSNHMSWQKATLLLKSEFWIIWDS